MRVETAPANFSEAGVASLSKFRQNDCMETHRNSHVLLLKQGRDNASVVDPSAGAGGFRKRRGNPRPHAGEALSRRNPPIKEVLCCDSGRVLSAEGVIGTDYAEAVQLRMNVHTRMLNEDPLYRCAICNVPVYVCCLKAEKKFFFKHRKEDGNCPAVTRGSLSQDEINARKYNGAKESNLHRQMKSWLAQCLTLDGRFKDVAQEPRWKGKFSGDWRQPDVRATYNSIPIAFEVQLSTTYLNVIAERRQFYLEQGGLLFWVFAAFEGENTRMLEDDVFYNNNQNAFVVNAHTVEDSMHAGEFRLECIWAEPSRYGGTGSTHRKTVAFHELTLDPATQRAYYFDFDGKREAISQETGHERERLRQEFDVWFGAQGFYSENKQADWDHFRGRFAREGIEVPRYVNELDRGLLVALYSAKHGRPFGVGYKKLVEVGHRVATGEKHHLVWFMHAAKQYGRLSELETQGSQKWQQKHEACRAEFRSNPKPFEPMRDQQKLVELLFPELLPLP